MESSISVQQCVAKRVLKMNCPLTCPFNPFNPDAPKAFDAIVGRGLAGASRWLEKAVGASEWARRFDAMDRRFMPERDLPLISYETQWWLLSLALRGEAYPEVRAALEGEDARLRNDARLVFEKLARSRALLVQVRQADDSLPYYVVRDVFAPEAEYLYVDFGEQEPLEEGALLFGRFLQHEDCLYVIPGVFVGTSDVLELIVEGILDYLGEGPEEAGAALQDALPEVWNLCAAIQDERDGVSREDVESGEEGAVEEPYRTESPLDCSKSEAVLALRDCSILEEVDPPEFGVDPMGESVFDVVVHPSVGQGIEPLEDEEDSDGEGEALDDRPVRVGTIYVTVDKIEITAVSPVELELVKALVESLIR